MEVKGRQITPSIFAPAAYTFVTPPQPSPLAGREHHLRGSKSPLLAGEIERGLKIKTVQEVHVCF
jgi:hypothetical protein